ncbi:MAG: hypothetical protein VCD50_15190 [Alphaproteobacteria bacterium]|jgi:hypothetical protein
MHRSETHKRQFSKNVTIAAILFFLVALFFSITLVRFGGTL